MSRAATSRLKVNPPLGTLPVLQYCAPDQLQIDEAYQRSLEAGSSQTLIRRIAVHWDWGLCQPLFVARRADGGLYVVDGQHRLEAAKLRGDIWQLPCVVSSFASAADEAASFVALNQQRRPLTALDLFKATLAAGDAEATAVVACLAAAALKLSNHASNNVMKPGHVCNVGGMLRCYRRSGEAALRTALCALAKAYPGEVLRYAGTIFPGIAAVVVDELRLRAAPTALAPELAAVTCGLSQTEWRQQIAAAILRDHNLNRGQASEFVFRQAWRARHNAPATLPRPDVVDPLPPATTVWCTQCDQRVSGAKANACASPFCKAKAVAA